MQVCQLLQLGIPLHKDMTVTLSLKNAATQSDSAPQNRPLQIGCSRAGFWHFIELFIAFEIHL